MGEVPIPEHLKDLHSKENIFKHISNNILSKEDGILYKKSTREFNK
jgi:hypothetical protein